MNFISLLAMLCIGCIFSQPLHLSAEIEKVILTWSSLCTKQCAELLEKEFKKIRGVEAISINREAGVAEIKWKPNAPFAFSDLNIPTRLVGLSIRRVYLRVKGNITHDAKSVALISIGDYTRFDLLNPVVSEPLRQSPVNNLAARQLTPELRQKLISSEEQKMIATVEGELFMPGRSAALQLVVDNLSLSTPSKPR